MADRHVNARRQRHARIAVQAEEESRDTDEYPPLSYTPGTRTEVPVLPDHLFSIVREHVPDMPEATVWRLVAEVIAAALKASRDST